MTKRQPCASKLRLSKICRWLITLGIAKLALFGAWSVDMPLPQRFFPGNSSSLPAPSAPVNAPVDKQPPADASARNSGDVRLAALFAEDKAAAESGDAAVRQLPESTPATGRASPVRTAPAPAADSGEAAVRSAAPLPSMPVVHLPWSKAARAEAEAAVAANTGERPLASGVDANEAALPDTRETATHDSWWREIMTLTQLPVPVLGVRRIAHAAAMDLPPPRTATPGASPFAPPEQAKVQPATPAPGEQDPSGAPLPLRPRPSAPQAGTPAAQGTGAPVPSTARAGAPPAPTVKSSLSVDSPERKQQELARREQDVLMLKQQMETRLQELQSAEKKVQGMLKEAHGVHDQKIKHLISAYTNMKPKQAAQALESLDERLAVRILAGMNPKQAGEVLTYTNPKTVAKLSELLARMQLPGE
ncbi:MAG: hypothetical protein LBC79_02410 [Deltaproteobacteria bacterium]|jgi:hypothetical protein|nr:hypothetical protein [Deltaproteobacteria bacterium]